MTLRSTYHQSSPVRIQKHQPNSVFHRNFFYKFVVVLEFSLFHRCFHVRVFSAQLPLLWLVLYFRLFGRFINFVLFLHFLEVFGEIVIICRKWSSPVFLVVFVPSP